MGFRSVGKRECPYLASCQLDVWRNDALVYSYVVLKPVRYHDGRWQTGVRDGSVYSRGREVGNKTKTCRIFKPDFGLYMYFISDRPQ